MYRTDELDIFVRQEMESGQVPGLALAVVKDGAVVHLAGYGVRDREQGLPVTAHTRFPIASITKSLTAATLAILVRQRRLDWDTPVRESLSDFHLADPTATTSVTLSDLLSHRTGLPRHDLVWRGAALSREEVYLRLQYLALSASVGERFQYNNLMYLVAGYLAGRVANSTWETVTRELLLDPLGMERAGVSIAGLRAEDDAALPYEEDVDGSMRRGAFLDTDAVGPAGGIAASVEEMAHFLSMYLDGGRYRGRRVLTETDLQSLWTPQIVVDAAIPWPELGPTHYGLGSYLSTYRGRTYVRHDGGLRGGFTTILGLLPEAGIGAVVLCNRSWTSVPRIVQLRIFDLLLGLPAIPWSDRAREEKKARMTAKKEARLPDVAPRRPISDYVGIFTHPAYGEVTIQAVGPDSVAPLHAIYHGVVTALSPVGEDRFEASPAPHVDSPLEQMLLRFHPDPNGSIARLSLPLEPAVPEISFVRAGSDQ